MRKINPNNTFIILMSKGTVEKDDITTRRLHNHISSAPKKKITKENVNAQNTHPPDTVAAVGHTDLPNAVGLALSYAAMAVGTVKPVTYSFTTVPAS